ncbi:MAG: FtsX-like permease family protein, partial [Muribaculaceae bacterium]|nr:FtsX-like permease family protein [Muribaculaceae bacterium]
MSENYVVSARKYRPASFSTVIGQKALTHTLKTAIKNEEKELGMLKALGVESASFNWLFAAKYLAFSLVGTVAGFFGGIHLAGLYVKYLAFNLIKPEAAPMVITALAASLMIFLLIILFVALALRRMKKISIMDVIAGENRGERFGKIPGLFLHKIKNINIPFYLAITDLITKIKRYSFLILAYVMGITLIIMCLELENTTNQEY